VRRGEATATVTATGVRTKFGRTAELVRHGPCGEHTQKAVLKIVRNWPVFNSAVILAMAHMAYTHAMPWSEIVPLLLTSILGRHPVALPDIHSGRRGRSSRAGEGGRAAHPGSAPWMKRHPSRSCARTKQEPLPATNFQ